MSVQLALRFDEVPITCETQQRYHSISPCLAGKRSAEEHADALGLSYSTVCRWLRKFREEGMPGLFPATDYPREPQTPVSLRPVGLTLPKHCQANSPKGYK